MQAEKARFVGFRLYEKERVLIRKWAKILKVSEAEVVRLAVVLFAEKNHESVR
jgi:hypothetical protein